MINNDEIFMKKAIELSTSAVEHGNEPFGAVLVHEGKIVCSNENQIYSSYVFGSNGMDKAWKIGIRSKRYRSVQYTRICRFGMLATCF